MRRLLAAILVPVGLLAAGCGDDEAARPTAAGDLPELRVSAAASLKEAFTDYGRRLEGVTTRFSFAGSDQLAAQIRAGGRPDVYVAANAALPRALHADGLVDEPVAVARNELVVAVEADSPVDALEDLAADGLRIAIGSPEVPAGAYARAALDALPAARRDAILANVRSEEPDVSGIVGKVAGGAVDAGFTYRTDVAATDGRLRAVPLPPSLAPDVLYTAAVVTGTEEPGAARAFVEGLSDDGPGAVALRRAGFLPPP